MEVLFSWISYVARLLCFVEYVAIKGNAPRIALTDTAPFSFIIGDLSQLHR